MYPLYIWGALVTCPRWGVSLIRMMDPGTGVSVPVFRVKSILFFMVAMCVLCLLPCHVAVDVSWLYLVSMHCMGSSVLSAIKLPGYVPVCMYACRIMPR